MTAFLLLVRCEVRFNCDESRARGRSSHLLPSFGCEYLASRERHIFGSVEAKL